MNEELTTLLNSGIAALGGLLVTDAYQEGVRPRVAALLRGHRLGLRRRVQLPSVRDLDRLSAELAAARARGEGTRGPATTDTLERYVRQMLATDPGLVEGLVALARSQHRQGERPEVHFSNNEFHNSPVQAEGTQIITYPGHS